MPGFSKFFKKMAEEEHEHAQMVKLYRTSWYMHVHLLQPVENGLRTKL